MPAHWFRARHRRAACGEPDRALVQGDSQPVVAVAAVVVVVVFNTAEKPGAAAFGIAFRIASAAHIRSCGLEEKDRILAGTIGNRARPGPYRPRPARRVRGVSQYGRSSGLERKQPGRAAIARRRSLADETQRIVFAAPNRSSAAPIGTGRLRTAIVPEPPRERHRSAAETRRARVVQVKCSRASATMASTASMSTRSWSQQSAARTTRSASGADQREKERPRCPIAGRGVRSPWMTQRKYSRASTSARAPTGHGSVVRIGRSQPVRAESGGTARAADGTKKGNRKPPRKATKKSNETKRDPVSGSDAVAETTRRGACWPSAGAERERELPCKTRHALSLCVCVGGFRLHFGGGSGAAARRNRAATRSCRYRPGQHTSCSARGGQAATGSRSQASSGMMTSLSSR